MKSLVCFLFPFLQRFNPSRNFVVEGMSLLILLVGIPSSGKTSWAKEYLKTKALTKIVSNDEIRKELTGTEECNPEQNQHIYQTAAQRAEQYLQDGYDVIVDGTNVTIEEWIRYKEITLRQKRAVIYACKIFDISVEEAMERQNGRKRKVPKEIILKKYNQLLSILHHKERFFNFIL